MGKNIFGIVSRNMRGKCRFGYCVMISLLVRSIGFPRCRVALSVEILRVALLLYIRILTVMGKEITSIHLDKIYRRIKDFRNICAHDERLYCAHPHDRNITVFQLVKDLRLVTDKKRYLEFLQQLESLLVNLEKDIPDYIGYVCCEMGLQNVDVLQTWMQTSRKL